MREVSNFLKDVHGFFVFYEASNYNFNTIVLVISNLIYEFLNNKQFIIFQEMDSERLYTSWYNAKQMQCKVVGPSTKCFCDHLYKYHKTVGNKVKCSETGCKCADFYYLPIYGSQDFRCSCKHSYQQHDVNKRSCKSCACKSFTSSWVCTCGMKFSQHKTISQKAQVKQKKGETVNSVGGGIVSYSSMLEGAERFGTGVEQEIKKKGLKIKIQELEIEQEPKQIKGEVSAWQLFCTPVKW